MSSLPANANEDQQPSLVRPGDATVVRGVAAFLVLLALIALLLIPGAEGGFILVTILAGAVGLFAAASWRRRA